MAKKRRIGAFSRRLSLSDLDLRTNAGKLANSIKNGLEAQLGAPTAGQQILIKLVAIKVLRCEMMFDQVLSNPRGGDLQHRVENYFLAWSNSIRRDLEALGVLDTPRVIVAVLIALGSSPPLSASEYRSRAVAREFQRAHPCPSTGKPNGACPGYRKDHVLPLVCGGPDAVSNMQWQTVAAAKAKDGWERRGCAR
jgi:hypothetical protein